MMFATVEFYPLFTEYISVIIINLRSKAIISRYNARLLASRPLEHVYRDLSDKFLNTTKANLFL